MAANKKRNMLASETAFLIRIFDRNRIKLLPGQFSEKRHHEDVISVPDTPKTKRNWNLGSFCKINIGLSCAELEIEKAVFRYERRPGGERGAAKSACYSRGSHVVAQPNCTINTLWITTSSEQRSLNHVQGAARWSGPAAFRLWWHKSRKKKSRNWLLHYRGTQVDSVIMCLWW